MCKFFSGIMTKNKLFTDWETDSHEGIITKNNLHEGDYNKVNYVRVELLPKDDNIFNHDMNNWELSIDQDLIPDWFDKNYTCELMKKRLLELITNRFILQGNIEEINEGRWFIGGSAKIEKVYGSAKIEKVCGSAKIDYVYGSAKIDYVYGSANIMNVCDSANIMNVCDSAKIGYVYGSANIMNVCGSAKIGYVCDSAKIEKVCGSANIMNVCDSANIMNVCDSAKIEKVCGSANILYFSEKKLIRDIKDKALAIKKENNLIIIISCSGITEIKLN